jgi:hypothetical protein
LKKLNEDLKVSVTTLQVLSDKQSASLQTKDNDVFEKDQLIKQHEERLHGTDTLKDELEEKVKTIQELK